MRVIIASSRSATEADVRKALQERSWIKKARTVISGTARGADRYGEKWAKENGLEIQRFPADWDKYGKRAGILRNIEMARNADVLVAVWDGKSPGTEHMIKAALDQGLRISVTKF